MEAFEPAGEAITPVVEVETHIGRVALHWFNTRIRLFGTDVVDLSQYNHAEFWSDDDEPTLHAVSNQELMDALFELHFPILTLPFVDSHTMEWYVELETRDIDTELDGLTP